MICRFLLAGMFSLSLILGACSDETTVGDGGVNDAQGDGGPGGDVGPFDGGSLSPCVGSDDCSEPEICFHGFCVEVVPDPDCVPGDEDHCQNDSYCDPEQGGCLPWEVRPEPEPRCEHIPPAGEFTPVEEWVWQNPLQAPEWDEVMMTPVVIDLEGQAAPGVYAVPAVVFNSFRKQGGYSQDGVLRALRGDTGEEIFSITDEAQRTHPVSNIAAGDLDGDGRPEIVTAKSGGRDLICFGADGSFKWATSGGQMVVGWGGPAIANLDGQGPAEIVMGAAVVDAQGQVLWSKTGSRGEQPGTAIAAPFSVPVDVDDDGDMEIVTGDVLYDHLGGELWNTGYGDGFVAVANFNLSEQPEIVVVSRGSVRLQTSTTGEILWLRTAAELNAQPECDPNCGLLGPPTVADFDGDGQPEIGVAGADVYLVLDGEGGDVLWSVPTRDSSSNITGSAVFDFEGDRWAEVVYADEVALWVLSGRDGHQLYHQPHSSLTACEYPVIADVDSDGNAEIIIAQNSLMDDAPEKFKGLRVFGDSQDNWVRSRRIWNQHSYHVTNVEENGSIPSREPANWLDPGLNNFRQNVQGSGLFDAPDLTVRGLGYDAGACFTHGLLLYALVINRGLQTVAPGLPVSFYLGDPRTGGSHLGTVRTSKVLAPGQSEQLVFLWLDSPINQPTAIFVVADDEGWDAAGNHPTGTHSECREHNNIGSFGDVTCLPET